MSSLNRRQKHMIMILVVVFVAFSIAVFMIPFKKGITFWISYIFETIALALQIPIFKLAFDNADELKSRVLGFPVFRVGYIYLGIQTIVSIILFSLGTIFTSLPVWISVVVCVLILATSLICSNVANIAREEVQRVEQVQKKDTSVMMKLRSTTATLAVTIEDSSLRNPMQSLAEEFRFSDPVSSEMTADIETELSSMVEQIQQKIQNNSITADDINVLRTKLSQRNAICKASKK